MELIVNLILITITSFSIAWIVTREHIFKAFRDSFKRVKFIHRLVSCPGCFSVWSGLLIALIWQVVTPLYLNIIIVPMLSYFFMKIMVIWINKNDITLED